MTAVAVARERQRAAICARWCPLFCEETTMRSEAEIREALEIMQHAAMDAGEHLDVDTKRKMATMCGMLKWALGSQSAFNKMLMDWKTSTELRAKRQ